MMPPLPSRREMMALGAMTCTGRRARAFAGYGTMMWDYLIRELDAADERRRRALAAIRNRGALAALQEKVRRTMQAGIGPFPGRTPLNARQTGEIRKPGYVIEKIVFESQPEYFVTANVYRPAALGGKRPAVVQSCGHYKEGKADPDYQQACIGLALRGFVSMIFDPMGQGERWMFYQRGQEPSSATTEHGIAGVPTLLVGRTLAHYRMWDFIRALDYLETRPDVDPARMGMLGHSGGGMMTLLTSPLEPRIKAAMSCCAVTTFYHKTKALLIADPEQIVPGIYPNDVDHPELIATVAPRAFLIGAVLRDFVPLDGTRRTYDEVKPIYEMVGVPQNFGKVESDNVHKLDQNLREACYGWMLQHLAGEKGDTREQEMTVESDQNLWCTPSGRVMDLLRARSVFDLNRSESQRLGRERAGHKPNVRRVLAVAAQPKLEAGVAVPSTLAQGTKGREILLVVVSEQGRNSAAAVEMAREFTDAGYAVLSVDLRGWGETACTKEKQGRFAWDEFFAWRAEEMGRPLLGMRVQDLLAVTRPMAQRYRQIYLVGIRAAGLAALHAAAIDGGIAGAASYQTLDSYHDVMEHVRTAEPVSSLPWGALAAYDLPELGRAMAPRPWVAVDAFNSARRPVGGNPMGAAEASRRILEGLHLA